MASRWASATRRADTSGCTVATLRRTRTHSPRDRCGSGKQRGGDHKNNKDGPMTTGRRINDYDERVLPTIRRPAQQWRRHSNAGHATVFRPTADKVELAVTRPLTLTHTVTPIHLHTEHTPTPTHRLAQARQLFLSQTHRLQLTDTLPDTHSTKRTGDTTATPAASNAQ